MASKKNSLQDNKIRSRSISIMDRELDDSLREIKKLLVINARISMLQAKESCKNPESEDELGYLHSVLDSLMSREIFQEQWK